MIKIERLKLVAFDQKYVANLYDLWSDFEVIKYTYMPQLHSTKQCAEKINMFIENTDRDVQNNFIILKDNQAIGIIGSPIMDKARAEFGLYYQMVRKYWGNGYISEALLAFKKHIINQFAEAKFNAEVVSENSASIAILKKAGFVEETVVKDGFTQNGLQLDLLKFVN